VQPAAKEAEGVEEEESARERESESPGRPIIAQPCAQLGTHPEMFRAFSFPRAGNLFRKSIVTRVT